MKFKECNNKPEKVKKKGSMELGQENRPVVQEIGQENRPVVQEIGQENRPVVQEMDKRTVPLSKLMLRMVPVILAIVAVIVLIFVNKQAKFLIQKSVDVVVEFAPSGISEDDIVVSPWEYTQQVMVEITAPDMSSSGTLTQYVLLDEGEDITEYTGEWNTYEDVFTVNHNCIVYARYARYENEVLVYESDPASKQITNIAVAGIIESGELTTYETLQEAVNACVPLIGMAEQKEIEILADINVDEMTPENGALLCVIPENANIVLDLNGHTIEYTEENPGSSDLCVIKNLGELEIKDSGLPDEDSILKRSAHDEFPVSLESFFGIERQTGDLGIITSVSTDTISNEETGELTVTRGVIETTYENGTAIVVNGGALILGKDDKLTGNVLPNVNKEEPSIYGELNGIKINSGELHFYDGIIKCSSGAGNPIVGKQIEIPRGYIIENKTITENSKEIKVAVLKEKAIFDTGSQVNKQMKRLFGHSTAQSGTATSDSLITSIEYSENVDEQNKVEVQASYSPVKIYMWADTDNGKIYWYSDDNEPYLNEDSRYLFKSLKGLETIDLTRFNTSIVENMSQMFYYCESLEELDLTGFDTSSVTNMSYMFYYCETLEQLDVTSFDTSSVTDMSYMFSNCTGLKQLDVSGLSNSTVTSMSGMFAECSNLVDLDLTGFNTSEVTSMYGMFSRCTSIEELDLSSFDTQKVTNTGYMFYTCTNLKTIYVANGWSTESVPNSANMFSSCKKIMGGAGTVYNSKNTNISYANIDEGKSNPGYLTAKIIFAPGEEFNIKAKALTRQVNPTTETENSSIKEIKQSKTIPEEYMVEDNIISAEDSILPIYAWFGDGTLYYWSANNKVHLNKDCNSMFKNFSALTDIDLLKINTRDVTNATNMFNNCTSIKRIWVGNSWKSRKITESTGMFYNCQSIKGIKGTTYNENFTDKTYAKVDGGEEDPGYLSYHAVFDTGSNVNVAMKRLSGQTNAGTSSTNTIITSIEYSSEIGDVAEEDRAVVSSADSLVPIYMWADIDSGKIYWYSDDETPFLNRDASNMFTLIKGIETLDLSNFNASETVNMSHMFSECGGLQSIEFGEFDTSQVEDMQYMFRMCTNLTSLDVSMFNTNQVTNTQHMFYYCRSLESLDVSNFSTSEVTNMSQMFYGCNSLESLDLTSFDTSEVTNMDHMFCNSDSLKVIDLSSFDTSKVTNMSGMFSACRNLETIYVGKRWNTTAVTNSTSMFSNCSNIIGGAGTRFINDNIIYAHVDGIDGTPGYLTGKIIFDEGTNFNIKIKELAGDENPTVDTENTTIKEIKFSETIEDQYKIGENNVASEESPLPIYAWFKDGTIYLWTESYRTFLNSNSSNMFKNLKELEELDLSEIYACNIFNTESMFSGCSKIESIWVNVDWNYNNIAKSTKMFYECTHIKGKSGTTFNSNYIDKKYARIDGGIEKPGYLSSHAIFDTGINVNKAMKELFGEINPTETSENTTITLIEYSQTVDEENKVIVSSEESPVAIYMWADVDNGKIYWYCDDETPYLNKDTSYMFSGLKGLTNIDLSKFNTNKVENMSALFYECNSIDNIDVTGFNTRYVTNMSGVFYGCSSLKSIDVTGFNTRYVTNMSGVFYGCSSLKTIDVKNFDTKNVERFGYMFANCTELVNLDLSSFNTRKAVDMTSMFSSSSNLETIYVGKDWYTGKLDRYYGTQKIFTSCGNIVGGLGTTYAGERDGYARIDGGTEAPGYLTGNVIFDTGENINIKMKALAGSTNPTVDTENTTIHDFRYSSTINEDYIDDDHKISADNSYSPIYMWYEDGVIYWWSNCIKPKLNPDSSNMFKNMKGLTSLDLTPYYTGDVTNMSGMFYECSNIEEIWVGTRWITDNVVDSTDMFYNCTKLVGIGGTVYNSSYTDKTYAKPDNAPEDPGYFSGEAVFMSGEVINVSMKALFGQSNPKYSTENTNIKAIEYSENIDFENKIKVSIHNSTLPIYMWKGEDNQTVYWYSANPNPKLNASAKYMFENLKGLERMDFTTFDTTKVTDSSYMFYNCIRLPNLNLSKANTSNVGDMRYMFYNCSSLGELDLRSFNTSNVTNMDYMFYGCSNLRDVDLTSFDTSLVKNMDSMFENDSKLITLDISSFNTEKVTTVRKMFKNCTYLETIYVGRMWDINSITSTNSSEMFNKCINIVGGAGTVYNDSTVNNTNAIVDGTNGNPGYLTGKAVFDIGENINRKMKMLTGSINPTVDTENTSILDIRYSSTITNEHRDDSYKVSADDSDYPIYMWYADGIIYWWSQNNKAMFNQDSSSMFKNLKGLTNLDLRPYYTDYATDMSNMFSGCTNIEKIWVEHGWRANKVTESTDMFNNCTSLVGIGGTQYNQDYKDKTYAKPDKGAEDPGYFSADARFDTGENVNLEIKKLLGIENPKVDTANTILETIEYSEAVDWDNKVKISEHSSVLPIYMWKSEDDKTIYWYCVNQHIYLNRNAKNMFNGLKGLKSFDFRNLDTSKTTDMGYMFYNCSSIESLDLEYFNTENVTTMEYMFYGCNGFNSTEDLKISSFNTSNVTNMKAMFSGCSGFSSIDLSNFNTSNVTNMEAMFSGCSGLSNINVNSFDTSEVTTMREMFEGCSNLEHIDIINFDTSKTNSMYEMFKGCTNLIFLDLSGFDTRQVTSIFCMFYNCQFLETIYVGNNWDTSRVGNYDSGSSVFAYCYNIEGGAKTMLRKYSR